MASPITHLAFATRALDRLAPEDTSAFLVGTSWPDIRKAAGIDRNETHTFGVSPEEIAQADSFEMGRLLHCWFDLARLESHLRNGIDEGAYGVFSMQSVKLLEDELTYSWVDDWRSITEMFQARFPGELQSGVTEAVVEGWHTGFRTYLAAPPTDASRNAMAKAGYLEPDSMSEINAKVAELRGDEDLKRRLSDSLGSIVWPA